MERTEHFHTTIGSAALCVWLAVTAEEPEAWGIVRVTDRDGEQDIYDLLKQKTTRELDMRAARFMAHWRPDREADAMDWVHAQIEQGAL